MSHSTPLLHRIHPTPRSFGWLMLLALSLLLHLLLLAAADGRISTSTALPQPTVTTVTLTATVTAAPPPAPVLLPAPQLPQFTPAPPKPRPIRRKPVAVPPQVSTAQTAAAPATTDAQPVQETNTAAAVASAETAAAAPITAPVTAPVTAAAGPTQSATALSTPEPSVPEPPAAASPAHRYRTSLPPSATLAYEVRYATRGSITRGSGVITWQATDAGYTIHGEVSKFGFPLSSFRSEGGVDAAGIAPVLYAEKNARRPETNTHFLRDARQAISFSASTDTYPLAAGSQDRSSILWQLAAIARGDPALLVPGTVFDIFVAGVRDAERWVVEVVGEETITIETGAVHAWHLVRAPRAGSYDKRLDIWLAPAQQWYPVKLRYTEASGDYLDLSLSAVR